MADDEPLIVSARPGIVIFEDPAVHERVSTQSLFLECKPKVIEAYGLILEHEKTVNICHFRDLTDEEESDGLILPRGCVIKIVYLEEAHMDVSKQVN